MYDEQKAALNKVCNSLENSKSTNENSVVYSVTIDNCISDIRHCISALEELERIYYGFIPGPDVVKPCDIMADCVENINNGCHLRAGCL